MENVRKMIHNSKEVLIVDYSGCRGEKLIEIFEAAKRLVLAENKHCVILSIFDNRTFISPAFMTHIKANVGEADVLIRKQAIIGLSSIQEWIVKGMNLWYKRQIYSFGSMEKALDFLTK